jgi:hypothetical protein
MNTMNRDEREAQQENMIGAEQIALGSLPAEILGVEAPVPYVLNLQAAVNRAVSLATRNSRQWTKETLHTAYQAARPIVEKNLRQQGRAFAKSDVRTSVRKSVAVYAERFGVALPGNMVLGKTDLEAVAGEICGALDAPWMAFVSPQMYIAKKAADAGQPAAKSWLKKIFGFKSKPTAVAAPSTAPVVVDTSTPITAAPAEKSLSVAAAPAVTSLGRFVGSSDSLGRTEILGSSDSLGAWLHALNPLYWLKSSQERKLIDAEKQAWIDNAALQKKLGKKQQIMESGEKALAAKQAVETAKARSAEMEAQLKAIESQVLGAVCGASFVGSQFVSAEQFVGAATKENPYDEEIPEADAAPTLKKIASARKLNDANKTELDAICAKMRAKAPLTPDESSKVLILLARNEQLHEFRKALINGDLYTKNPSAKDIQRHVTLGAMKAMTPAEQQMVTQMIALAKQGNPNAKKGLQALKDQGYAVTMGYDAPKATVAQKPLTPAEQTQLTQMITLAKQGNTNAQKALQALQAQGYNLTSSMGFGISDAFKIATAPIVWSTQLVAKGAQRLFGKGGGGAPATPAQLRLQRLQAAAKRRKAAAARARAADAETQAEYRSQNALAAAADAEADADDAEANAKEAAMITAETEHQPGEVMGSSKPIITPLPPTPAPTPTANKFNKDVERRMLKKAPTARKIFIKSEEASPTGMKLKASIEVYRKAKKNKKSPEYKAVKIMVKKAKAGDKQALSDVRSMQAARLAVNAERAAQKHVTRVYTYRAANAKGKAVQKRAEVAMSNTLIRQSRASKLRKMAKIERGAAAGNKQCVAFVKTHVAKAKAGDKKSKQVVTALQLSQHARKAAPTRAEQRNLAQARRLARGVAKGNRKAIMQTRVIAAAAKAGNPNAKRARKRLQTAAAIEMAIGTGVIVLPAVVITSEIALKRQQEQKAQLAKVEAKVTKGTASREEAVAASKSAANLGDKEKARELATVATTLPSAVETLKQTATVLAAADAGSPAHTAAMNKAETLAAAGEPAGVEAMGKVSGVQALNQVAKGKPIAPEMKVAVQDLTAAHAGDEVAQAKIETMQTQAAAKDPVAIKYMVAATGAAVVAKSLASNPVALEEWQKKAGAVPATSETEDTDLTKQSILPARLSTLPDDVLPPIKTVWGLVKASLSAITLATRDPFANYRAGVVSRGQRTTTEAPSSAGAILPTIAAFTAPLAVDATKSVIKEGMILSAKSGARAGAQATKKAVSGSPKKKPEGDKEEVDENDYMVHGEVLSVGAAKHAALAVRPPSAGKVIDMSKEKGLKSKSVDENDYEMYGDAVPEEHKKHVEPTKNKLAAIKTASDKGDKDAQKKWSTVVANLTKARAKAGKGDEKAKTLVAVLEATGLFAK